MRRKKDDKRVLRSGNGRQSNSRRLKSNRHFIPRRQKNNVGYGNPRNPRIRRTKSKRSKKLVLVMIIALLAFVIGAGIGISLSFDNGDADEGPHYQNVTKNMTSNLNETEDVYYDKTTDAIDYNENTTSQLQTTTDQIINE